MLSYDVSRNAVRSFEAALIKGIRFRAFTQVLGEEADTLRHTLAELGVRIGRDQVSRVARRLEVPRRIFS